MSDLKTYTLEEVSKHNSESDCWIIIEGNVYDVTEYLEHHPGGVDIVTEVAGMDATEEFHDVGHSEDAFDLLKKYHIGTVEMSSPEQSQKNEQRNTLNSRNTAYSTGSARENIAGNSNKANQDDSTLLYIAGAAVVATAAYFFLRRKK